MKNRILILIFLFAIKAIGQKTIQPTDSFTISGSIKQEKVVQTSELNSYPNFKIKNLTITNHLGEKKSTLKKVRGVKLLDVLKDIEIDNENPKLMSEYYFVFIASDGYKVAFSWNEIFNSPTGQNIYLLTEINGTKIHEMSDRIVTVTPSDHKTGRRYLKGLSEIVVKRI